MRGQAQGRYRSWRALAAVALAAGLVGGSFAGARAWFDTRDAIDRAEASVRDTRDRLARSRAELGAAVDRLEAERTTLQAELAALGVRQDERDAAQGSLTAAEGRLADLKAELAAAIADLEQRQARLDALDRCLRGAVGGLNQAAVADSDGLEATLARLEDPCERAGAAL